MIEMNWYVTNKTTASTADMLRGCAHKLVKLADSMDKPNELLQMLNDVFDVVTREGVAAKIEQLAAGCLQVGLELRGDVIDQRPMPR